MSTFKVKTCERCGALLGPLDFSPINGPLYKDGVLPICDQCVEQWIGPRENDDYWTRISRLCQMADVPFEPVKWEQIWELNKHKTFHKYCELYTGEHFQDLHWDEYWERYKQLEQEKRLDQHLPLLDEAALRKLREKWGAGYDAEGYNYLEELLKGICDTQNVSGALQINHAMKLCKISYEIDKRIEEGQDFDKLMGSYEKLIKTAEFTPKNVKNANDFDSIGEVVKWFEKQGWKNQFYDGETRDVVDETIKSMQIFNQRLYTQEVSIGDEITRRAAALASAHQLETSGDYYGTDQKHDLNQDEVDAMNELWDDDQEEMEIDG